MEVKLYVCDKIMEGSMSTIIAKMKISSKWKSDEKGWFHKYINQTKLNAIRKLNWQASSFEYKKKWKLN